MGVKWKQTLSKVHRECNYIMRGIGLKQALPVTAATEESKHQQPLKMDNMVGIFVRYCTYTIWQMYPDHTENNQTDF